MPYGALPIGFNDLLYAFNDSISVTEEYFDCVGEEEEKIAYKIDNLKKVDQNKLKPSEIAVLDKVNNYFKKKWVANKLVNICIKKLPIIVPKMVPLFLSN